MVGGSGLVNLARCLKGSFTRRGDVFPRLVNSLPAKLSATFDGAHARFIRVLLFHGALYLCVSAFPSGL